MRPIYAKVAVIVIVLAVSISSFIAGAVTFSHVIIPSSGTIDNSPTATTLGKNVAGSSYWYVDTAIGNNKIGTKYHLDHYAVFNAMFARLSSWPSSSAVIRLGIIDSTGSLVAITGNISIPATSDYSFRLYVGLFGGNVSLNAGDYYLTLWAAKGAVAYKWDAQPEAIVTFSMNESINSPTGTFPAPSMYKEFDVFAVFLNAGQSPVADIQYRIPSVPSTTEVGKQIDFDASSSIEGFNGTALTPITYLWNFGDGSTSTQKIPSKTYSSAGDYLVTLKVTDTQGLSSTDMLNVFIKPVGGYGDFTVDFSKPEAYAVGLQHSGNYKYWDRENFFWTPNTHSYRMDSSVLFNGNPSGRLELLNPQSNVWGTNRMQIYSDLDPINARYVYQTMWFMLPTTLAGNTSQGQRFWYVLDDAIAERHYNSSLRYTAQQFGIVIGLLWNNGYSSSGYQYMYQWNIHNIPTTVDNDNNGVDDMVQAPKNFTSLDYLYGNATYKPVQLGVWCKLSVALYRNPDYRTNPTGGFLNVKIENITGSTLLNVNYTNIRTVGIWPEALVSDTPWGTPNQNSNYMTLFNAGYSLYMGGLDGSLPNSFGVPSYFNIGAYTLKSSTLPQSQPG